MNHTAVVPYLPAEYDHHNDAAFLAPTDLAVTPAPLTRIAFIGSCHLASWGFHRDNPSGVVADVVNTNNGTKPPPYNPDQPYDFQVVQMPLRSVVSDARLIELARANDDQVQAAFDTICQRMAFQLEGLMTWNAEHGLLTFVANFPVPQRNPIGMLFRRFDLRNPEYLISRLNEHLESLVLRHRNAYILDLDRITASIGRRHIQDDIVASTAHNAGIGANVALKNRMEPSGRLMDHFRLTPARLYPDAVWAEIIAMYRVVRQVDTVKAVILDLDDTLWNGVSGDMSDAEIGPDMIRGWSQGLIEALHYLKLRGILLAIISKNEESRIRQIWPRIFGNRLSLSDFAAVRINWHPKVENMADILAGMNILPRSVVFVDDNPVERNAMHHAYPDMRILGRHPFYIRHSLLWAPETQVASITEESSRRTEMIQRQFERESLRKTLSRDEFLRSASPVVTVNIIKASSDKRFARAFELINKTNQFNTTGRRWTHASCEQFLEQGGQLLTFEVEDQFTGNYGLVGVVMSSAASIDQWVMSCRVLGLGVEEAVMANIVAAMRANGARTVTGHLVETDVNFPCRDLFSRCGFQLDGDVWILAADNVPQIPGHVTIR